MGLTNPIGRSRIDDGSMIAIGFSILPTSIQFDIGWISVGNVTAVKLAFRETKR